ncbi:hypothetical protein K466DRAFT_276826 [Polyporus arcularius HHB13444]|uniref:Uncharacterized protein n=1 Tax=Polyporus arcularius HHB13444 TaxID=1314778 RepID=A0A5C3P401_9APHY|nr:hypothetical protein K466DRAFT_276826 [Polyporus arcularius HHB13444]
MRIGPQPLLDTAAPNELRLSSWGSERFLTRPLLLFSAFCGASHSILQPHSGANANVPYLTTYSPPLPGHRLPARAHTVRPPGVPMFDVRCSIFRCSELGPRHSALGDWLASAAPARSRTAPASFLRRLVRGVSLCAHCSLARKLAPLTSPSSSSRSTAAVLPCQRCHRPAPSFEARVAHVGRDKYSPVGLHTQTPLHGATPRTASNATKMPTGTALLDSQPSVHVHVLGRMHGTRARGGSGRELSSRASK